MRIPEATSHAGTGVGRTAKASKVAHNPAPTTERGKRRAARRAAAAAAAASAAEEEDLAKIAVAMRSV